MMAAVKATIDDDVLVNVCDAKIWGGEFLTKSGRIDRSKFA
jgi:hypothetical protein